MQANAKLKKQLEALQKASSASTAKPSSQKRPRTPPSSAAASKKPTFSPQSEDEDGPEDFDIFGTPRYEPSDESGGENEIVGEGEEGEDDEGGANTKEGEGELSESAKNQRLRRICEVKPGTGVCRVPDEIHARWKKGGTERLKLRDELEAAGWDKEWFYFNVGCIFLYACTSLRQVCASRILLVCHVICLHAIYIAVFKCFWGTLRNINLPSKF